MAMSIDTDRFDRSALGGRKALTHHDRKQLDRRSIGAGGPIDRERFGPWAVVTGASSGIGLEFARRLAASGINIVLVSRRPKVLEEIGIGLTQEFGVSYRVIEADLANDAGPKVVADMTADLDVGLLVSNA